jgi:hypothetical protein
MGAFCEGRGFSPSSNLWSLRCWEKDEVNSSLINQSEISLTGVTNRVMALLREVYGPGVERLRIEHQNFETPSKKKLEIVTIASNYHIEVKSC